MSQPQNTPSHESSNRRRGITLAALALLVSAGVAYAFLGQPTKVAEADPNEIAKELREQGREMDPEARQERIDRLASLSDEEKAELDPESERVVRRAEMRQRMQDRVDGFFDTPLEERDAYLDETLDEIMKRMAERDAERARREAAGEPAPERRRGRPEGGDGPNADRGDRPDADRGNRGERDGRGDGARRGRGGGEGNSVQQAKRAEFAAALMQRAKERGIELPFGPGRGRGPRG